MSGYCIQQNELKNNQGKYRTAEAIVFAYQIKVK